MSLSKIERIQYLKMINVLYMKQYAKTLCEDRKRLFLARHNCNEIRIKEITNEKS